jgi:hypothetical protein
LAQNSGNTTDVEEDQRRQSTERIPFDSTDLSADRVDREQSVENPTEFGGWQDSSTPADAMDFDDLGRRVQKTKTSIESIDNDDAMRIDDVIGFADERPAEGDVQTFTGHTENSRLMGAGEEDYLTGYARSSAFKNSRINGRYRVRNGRIHRSGVRRTRRNSESQPEVGEFEERLKRMARVSRSSV